MDDLISRQAIINSFRYDDDGTAWDMDDIVYRLEQFPSTQPEQQWIPCSERMPEKNGIYFVSYEDADTWLLEWLNGKWFVYPSNPAREETGTITAWMPLPEPYIER